MAARSSSRKTPEKPPKLTPQREHFARLVVRGYTQAEAYRRSFNTRPGSAPSTAWVEGSKLANNPQVRQRIDELTAEAAKRAAVSRESMLLEMAQNRDLALDAGEIGPAVTSSRDRARVAGLLVDRLEHTGKDGAAIAVSEEVTIEDRSLNELARRIAFTLALGKRKKSATPA